MPKKSIREAMLARRKHLAATTCFTQSLTIQKRFLELPEFHSAHTLALYSPIFNEVFTEEIFRVASEFGKKVAYPRVREDSLDFLWVGAREELAAGRFGVLEPLAGDPVAIEELDLLVVPGVAFDLDGYRLGFGKGFYDRVLHRRLSHCRLVALCYEFQLVEALPAEDHDVGMDLLVTEERTVRCRN